jgi:solute carrier family 35 protein F5
VTQDDPLQPPSSSSSRRTSTNTAHGQSYNHPDRPPSTLTTRTLGVRRSNSLIRSLSPSPALITHSQLHTSLSTLPARTEAEFHTHTQQHHNYQSGSESAIADPDFDGEYPSDNDHPEVQLQPIPSQPDLGLTGQKLTSGETAHLAATFCIVWFAANWTVNASLGLTSVGSSTVLAGMSGESRGFGGEV